MQLSDFHFDLPEKLIAKYPSATRSGSRLLALNSLTGEIKHHQFSHIIDYLQPNDLLVFNDTKVIPARLFGKKHTGGQVELLIERIIDETFLTAQIRASKPPRPGDAVQFTNGFYLEIIERKGVFYTLHYPFKNLSLLQFIEQMGHIPLPPYMQREAQALDKERYQTIYARADGSVAAPTAGLHFDEILMVKLREKKIQFGFLTLHIGAGTFTPIRTMRLQNHVMHSEYLIVDEKLCEQIATAKARGSRIIAVGTTSIRALETAAQSGKVQPYRGETNIFIYPGYKFRCADALITNFHLPCSTLLMLVSAFGGYDPVMHAYQQAVAFEYRFYSYGDAMFLTRNNTI